MSNLPELITVSEAAAILKVSPETIRNHALKGHFVYYRPKHTRTMRIDKASFLEWSGLKEPQKPPERRPLTVAEARALIKAQK